MNDFKTSGIWVTTTSAGSPDGYNRTSAGSLDTCHSPYVWNVDSHGGLCVSDAILNHYNLVLDCKDVTFRLNELDITLAESKMKEYLDNISTLTINGIKFIKEG